MKVLVFGRHGQVGGQLCRLLDEQGIEKVALDIDDLDLTDLAAIDACIAAHGADWVINGSAHTAVDRAESEVELSYRLNEQAPAAMASACATHGSKFVHYSTDYVFNGAGERPYRETDEPDPRSVYGKSKLAGERAVTAALPGALILRTAWVYSKAGNNFVNTMLRLAGERDTLRVVADQFGSPTLADDLAAITVAMINAIQSGQCPHRGGIYHATGAGYTNWYEFCCRILDRSGNDRVTVEPIPTSDYPTPAPRPAYSVLDNSKLAADYGLALPHWHDALDRCLRS